MVQKGHIKPIVSVTMDEGLRDLIDKKVREFNRKGNGVIISRSEFIENLLRIGIVQKDRVEATIESARHGIEYDRKTGKQYRVYYGEKGTTRKELKDRVKESITVRRK